ncbi:MAG: hypothetical protein IT567_04005 [Alphaproteobacteria bacterium]|nr:hypothetical protein [Alphaproteobacteria bacterium]
MSQTVDLKKKSKEVDAVDLTMFDDPESQINFISMVLGKEHGWEATIHDPQTRPEDGPDRMPHIKSTLEKAGYTTHLKKGKDVNELRVRNIGTRESFMVSVRELGLVKGIGHTISIIPEKIHEAVSGMKRFVHAIVENPQRAIGIGYLGGDVFYGFTGWFDKTRNKEEGKTENKKEGFFSQFQKPIVWRKNFAGYCFTVMSVILLAFGKEGREAVMDDLMKGYNKMLAEGQDLSSINWEEATKPSNPVRGLMEKYSLNIASALMVAGKLVTIDSAAFRLDYEMGLLDLRKSQEWQAAGEDGRAKLENDLKKRMDTAVTREKGISRIGDAWTTYNDIKKTLSEEFTPAEIGDALRKHQAIEKAGGKKVEGETFTLTAREKQIVDLHNSKEALEGVVLEVAGPLSSAMGWGLTAIGQGSRTANAMITGSSFLSLWGGIKIQNPMQVIGESIYLTGDAFLWLTGEREFNTEVAKATAVYLRAKAPYVLSPQGEAEVVKYTARRYAEEELKAESKDKNFKPSEEKIHEKAIEFEKAIAEELTHVPSRFDRVVTQAASIVSQFSEADGMRDKAMANMLEFIKGASVAVKAEEDVFAKAIADKVASMQGREASKGRVGSRFLTVKELAGDAAALMDAIPGSKYAANVLKLHELLVDAGARRIENGASRIVQTHREQVMNEAKAQSTKVHVAPQAQSMGVSPA